MRSFKLAERCRKGKPAAKGETRKRDFADILVNECSDFSHLFPPLDMEWFKKTLAGWKSNSSNTYSLKFANESPRSSMTICNANGIRTIKDGLSARTWQHRAMWALRKGQCLMSSLNTRNIADLLPGMSNVSLPNFLVRSRHIRSSTPCDGIHEPLRR